MKREHPFKTLGVAISEAVRHAKFFVSGWTYDSTEMIAEGRERLNHYHAALDNLTAAQETVRSIPNHLEDPWLRDTRESVSLALRDLCKISKDDGWLAEPHYSKLKASAEAFLVKHESALLAASNRALILFFDLPTISHKDLLQRIDEALPDISPTSRSNRIARAVKSGDLVKDTPKTYYVDTVESFLAALTPIRDRSPNYEDDDF